MNRMLFWKHILRLTAIACCLFWCGSAMAQLHATLGASPADYRGSCPGVITFNGTITSDKAQTVTYIFTRSDGATDTLPKTLTFTGPGAKSVSTTWTLGGDGLPSYVGWEAVKITKPSVVTSAPAKFNLRCNPPAHSILAAHGNTDWHIDTANEFLFGRNMAGTLTAPNHAPDGWSKTHIHIGLTNTAKYYFDKAIVSTGDDTNIPNGIDRTMLFFYAGHGNPTFFSTLGDGGTQSSMRLANLSGGGNLRYYWQCSCEVFAHGPEICSPGTMDYSCPDKFTGGADSVSMRNVFQRWGPALTPDLRMACGGSTEMYCHTQEVNRAWSDYGHGTIAHMFLDGFGENGAYGVVPLCMTLGGSDITKTPLYDTDFTTEPNTSGTSHYYLMYPSGTAQSATSMLTLAQMPRVLQRYRLIPPPPPEKFRALMVENKPAQIASTLVAGGNARMVRVQQTGALHLDSGQVALPSARMLEEREYVQRAASFLREQGLEEQHSAEPMVTRYMTASIPVDSKSSEVQKAQAGVSVVYKRVIPESGTPIQVLGSAGTIRVHLNNEGAVLTATKLWRNLEAIGSPVAPKGLDQARAEAERKLGASGAYKLSSSRLGYKQETDKAGQEQLSPVFQFAFVPVKAHDSEHPPQLIEVSALAE